MTKLFAGFAAALVTLATTQTTLPKGTVIPEDSGTYMRPWVELQREARQQPVWYVTLADPSVTGHEYARVHAKDRLGALSAVTVWSQDEWINGGMAAEAHIESEHRRLLMTKATDADEWDPFDRMTIGRPDVSSEPLAKHVCIDGPLNTVPSSTRCVEWAEFIKWLNATAK